MQRRGRITQWNDDRGFGYIAPARTDPKLGAEEVFVHIKAFERLGRRPAVGEKVSYRLVRDARGRPVAERVLLHGDTSRVVDLLRATTIALLFLGSLWLLGEQTLLPRLLFWFYVFLSVLAVLSYGRDKLASIRKWRRTPESTLQLLALGGGWPGALIAQPCFRHKTSKATFQSRFRLCVLLNLIMLALLLTPYGAAPRDWLRTMENRALELPRAGR